MNPTNALATLSRAELAVLGREYLLAGHMIDRAGMPHVLARSSRNVMRDVAIEEWMGASPVYTRRMQRALDFVGDDVATIFKGMQLDIGAPHEFMDFRYRVDDETHGEFWLAHCGALMDVEPMGEDFVVAMCHDIEDPTFDATACATNPRARMRPVHRPPRPGIDHDPPHPLDAHSAHCDWLVTIEPDAERVREPEAAGAVAASRAAATPIARVRSGREAHGWTDYGGPFEPDFRFELLARDALLVVLDEICLQGHLLVHSFLLATERRFGAEAARDLGRLQFTGVAGLVAERLARARGLTDGGLEAVAEVLRLHPAFGPRSYVDLDVTADAERVTVTVGDCPALHEAADRSWMALLVGGTMQPLEAIVQAVDPRARCHTAPCPPGATAAWEIVVEPDTEPAPEAPEVTLAKFSRGADFEFRPAGSP